MPPWKNKMPPKGVSKTVSKKCPECKRQMPVASRCCPCGYQFFEERRKSTASNNSEHDDMENGGPSESRGMVPGHPGSSPAIEVKRRSERVKREKPNFYDSLEYDNKMRKARKDKQKEESSQLGARLKRERKIKPTSDYEDDDDMELMRERKKKKRKKRNGDRDKDGADDQIVANVSVERQQQYGVVLCDINMKLGLNNPSCYI